MLLSGGSRSDPGVCLGEGSRMIRLPVRGNPLDDPDFADDMFDEVDDDIPPGFFDEVNHEVDDDPIEDFDDYDILDDDDDSFMPPLVPARQGDVVHDDNNPQRGLNAHDYGPPPPLAEDSGAEDGPPAKRFRIRGKTSVGLNARDTARPDAVPTIRRVKLFSAEKQRRLLDKLRYFYMSQGWKRKMDNVS